MANDTTNEALFGLRSEYIAIHNELFADGTMVDALFSDIHKFVSLSRHIKLSLLDLEPMLELEEVEIAKYEQH